MGLHFINSNKLYNSNKSLANLMYLSVGVVCTVPNRSMTGSGSALGGDEVPAAGTEAGAGGAAGVGAGDENESGQNRKKNLIKSVFINDCFSSSDTLLCSCRVFFLPVLKRLKQTCREEEAEGGSKHPCILTVYPHP